MSGLTIRPVTLEDAEALAEIYRPYVENTAITYEMTAPDAAEFAKRIESITKKYPYFVGEIDGEIVGYVYASVFKSREAYDRSVETSIYIREDRKGSGIGKKLYQRLEEELKKQNVTNLYACIAYACEYNDHLDNSSMYFHEKLGYALIGRFQKCAYKFDQWYDMIWMEKMLGEHITEDKKFIPYSKIKNA